MVQKSHLVSKICCKLTLVLPNCHSFFVLSYLVRRSVLLFLSSPAAVAFSFRMILYLRGTKGKTKKTDNKRKTTSYISKIKMQRHKCTQTCRNDKKDRELEKLA